MRFSYASPARLADIPCLDAASLRAAILTQVAHGWRVLAFFGLPRALYAQGELALVAGNTAAAGLCCVMAHDQRQELWASRCLPLERYASMSQECPQLQRFEREVCEAWGIVPEGHPWLKPVRYTTPASGAERPGPAQCDHYRVEGGQVHEVAVGPVHAGIIEPGHFRFQCYGENVLNLEISLGFQHRGVEKMLAGGPHLRDAALMECVAGDTSVGHCTAYSVVLERLAGVSVPLRAQLLRRMGLEFERLANHTGDLGAIAGDTGFLPTSSWNGRIRGDFLNMTAEICGNRFGRGLVCPGGVNWDLDPAACRGLLDRLRAGWRDVKGAVDVMFASPSVLDRLTGTGCVSLRTAEDFGMVGVAARACGLPRDARRHAPLSRLPLEDTDIRTAQDGDVLGRATVRRLEVADSVRLVEADLQHLARLGEEEKLREGESDAALWRAPMPEALPGGMLAVAQVEGWRGELCHVAVTDAEGRFGVYKIYDPSWHNWSGLEMALRGEQISDFPLCNKSFNLSYCGHDL